MPLTPPIENMAWAIMTGLTWTAVCAVAPWQSSRYLMARNEHVVIRSSVWAAIGVAAGHTITGLIIGGSVGGGVGLVTGIVSPGLHYKAKKGEPIILELKDNLKLPN